MTDTIDFAIRDYEISDDAMRWTPDAEAISAETPSPEATITVRANTRQLKQALLASGAAINYFLTRMSITAIGRKRLPRKLKKRAKRAMEGAVRK